MITAVFVFSGKHKVNVDQKVAAKHKKVHPHPVELNLLVRFSYPSRDGWLGYKDRTVRLVATNDKYITGLEISDKNRFKKFLRTKVTGLQLIEFNSKALAKS